MRAGKHVLVPCDRPGRPSPRSREVPPPTAPGDGAPSRLKQASQQPPLFLLSLGFSLSFFSLNFCHGLPARASTRQGWLGSQQPASPPPPTSPGEELLCASESPPRAGQPEGKESPHGTQLEPPALELAASGNLSVGLVLLHLEHPLLAVVHLLAVPVRLALMLILGSLYLSAVSFRPRRMNGALTAGPLRPR